MSKIFKNFTKNDKIAFWLCLSISVILLVASFLLPPTGKIDTSVLQAVGEIFAFATLYTVIVSIGRGGDITLKKGDTEVTLNNPDGDEK
jgi:hypothetical protein